MFPLSLFRIYYDESNSRVLIVPFMCVSDEISVNVVEGSRGILRYRCVCVCVTTSSESIGPFASQQRNLNFYLFKMPHPSSGGWLTLTRGRINRNSP